MSYFHLGASAEAETGSHPTGQAQCLGASRFDPARWQPIETCPIPPFVPEKWFMSGERYLLFRPTHVAIGHYSYTKQGKGRWQVFGRAFEPTHWMPLPAFPEA